MAKRFDCVEMQHRGGERLYAEIGNITREEELAFWAEQTEAVRQRLRAAHAGRDQEHGQSRAAHPEAARAGSGRTRTKAFDCVEMKRRGAERIYEETKDLTREELLAYWEQRTRAFREFLAAVRAEQGQVEE